MPEKTIALLVAAGSSSRMEAGTPKPYLSLAGEPVLRRAVRIFLEHPLVDGVRVVIRRQDHALYKQAVQGLTLFPCVVGGDSRQESVRRGLKSLTHRVPQHVLVHDVARPLLSPALITRVVQALASQPCAIPALAITDTLKTAADGLVTATQPRDGLFAAQTPQGFHYAPLLAAHHAHAGASFTDDAQLMEQAGHAVALVAGERHNLKLTTQEDLAFMQAMLAQDMETRTGLGFDVHALIAHDDERPPSKQYIKLCGVRVPHTHYLAGHSDADVGLHAMVDAILGAMGAGDIGVHFPPDDARWKGADSSRFLMHAYELLRARGGELVHIDLTLVCERPKIAPHREAMIAHIAQLLKLDAQRISIKATTTEKLGFTGRGEGIAAQAVATVRLPR
jgi:2-C-methyl-D-erythritol 4-phosphate cytidylyltransferase/2-C-methyl-D-erythritol 2,4-cyclodiphosphate synthase